MRGWRGWIVPVLLILCLTLAPPAQAGAPGEGETPPAPVGGVPPEGEAGAEGWTEYPASPSAVPGVPATPQDQAQGEIWPPFLGDIFGWIGDNLNPGKWATDTINGALTGLLRALIGLLAQVVFWIYGREVVNPYEGLAPGSAAPTAQGLDVVLTTPAAYTYQSPQVRAILPNIRGGALVLLGLAILWVSLRELVRLASGEAHGYHLGESLRRLVAGAFLAAGAGYWLVAQMIRLNNLMITSMLGDPLTDVLRDMILFDRSSDLLLNAGLIIETAAALLLLLLFLLVHGGIMTSRIILLDVLLLFSPLAGASYATEESSSIFHTWMRVAVGAVFYQFVSVLFLELGGRLMGQAWSGLAGGHPLLMAALSMATVFMAIGGPAVLGFALRRASGGEVAQRVLVRLGRAI